MVEALRPDICVIGGGSAGLSVAATAAAFGVSVVLVERGAMGGDCLNTGCIPSKALLAAARHAQALREATHFGVLAPEPAIDFAAVQRHVHGVIAEIAPTDSAERFAALGVTVIKAEARFVDARTVLAGDTPVQARRFILATGSSPRIPAIAGLDRVPYLTHETVFAIPRLPKHLLVLGAGPVGLELAQAFRRLGAAVTVVEAKRPLGRDDPELVAEVVEQLGAEGVRLLTDTAVERVDRHGRSGVRLTAATGPSGASEAIVGSHLLVAAGRTPSLAALDLDKAGIATRRDGIVLDRGLRTSNRRVYAIGDAAGALQFTHVASYHAALVSRALLFRLPVRPRREILPWVTFTDPELAKVGLTEAEALAAGHTIKVLRWPLAENDRARTERRTRGAIKVIAGRGGRILGASIVSSGAGELIGVWGLAIARGLTLRHMAEWLPPYPTMGEIGRRAAIAYFAGMTRKPLVRRIVRLLQRFG